MPGAAPGSACGTETVRRLAGEKTPLPRSRMLEVIKLAVFAIAPPVACATSLADLTGCFTLSIFVRLGLKTRYAFGFRTDRQKHSRTKEVTRQKNPLPHSRSDRT